MSFLDILGSVGGQVSHVRESLIKPGHGLNCTPLLPTAPHHPPPQFGKWWAGPDICLFVSILADPYVHSLCFILRKLS